MGATESDFMALRTVPLTNLSVRGSNNARRRSTNG